MMAMREAGTEHKPQSNPTCSAMRHGHGIHSSHASRGEELRLGGGTGVVLTRPSRQWLGRYLIEKEAGKDGGERTRDCRVSRPGLKTRGRERKYVFVPSTRSSASSECVVQVGSTDARAKDATGRKRPWRRWD